MCEVLSNYHKSYLRYGATCEKKHTPVLVTKSCNSRSFNFIFTKKYTDHMTIIRNNFIKFQDIWMIHSQVTGYGVRCLRRTDGHQNLYTIIRPDKILTSDGRIKTCITNRPPKTGKKYISLWSTHEYLKIF